MTSPPEDPIHAFIKEQVHVEMSGWAPRRVEDAMRRLQGTRTGPAFTPVVCWIAAPIAFTLSGRYVYISRELLSRGLTDSGTAFVLAHEIAHHELGHLGDPGDGPLSIAWRHVRKSSADEFDADEHALKMCIRADYSDSAAAEAFGLLKRLTLDHRQLGAVFDESTSSGSNAWLDRLARKYLRSHPPIETRLDRLRATMLEHRNPSSSFSDYVAVRRRWD